MIKSKCITLYDYTDDEKKILRQYTQASQNGYADLICLLDVYESEDDDYENSSDVVKMLIDKGYKFGDEVLVHYTW
jgi:hypothetical protein